MKQLDTFIESKASSSIKGVLILSAITLMPCALLASVIYMYGISRPEMPRESWNLYLADNLVASPLIEGALVFPVLWLFGKFSGNPRLVAFCSALAWAIFHALKFISQGFVVLWLFYILSRVALRWRPVSKNRAYITIVVIHAIHNAGMIYLERAYWF